MTPSPRASKPALLARLDRRHTGFIEASAGTGKTFTLEHLVVDLLLETEARLPNILVVTYTDKATAELKLRVRATLERLLRIADGEASVAPPPEDAPAWVLDAAARRRLVRALDDFGEAQISTIHAFCQRVLSESAFHAGRLLEEEVVTHDALDEVFADWLRAALAPVSPLRPLVARWLASNSQLRGLQKLCVDVLKLRAPLWPPLDEPRLRAAVAAVAALPVYQWAPPAVAALQRDCSRPMQGDERLAALHAHDLKAVEALAPTELAPPIAELRQALPSLRALLVERCLPSLLERFRAHKRAAGVVDFDDLIALTRQALDGPGGAALVAALRRRYHFGLVDEFQDTDEVQWHIFRRVFVEAGAAEPRPLFLVGDPKQAIYGFRGADVHTYLAARDEVVAARGSVTSLAECYRATPQLIDALHAILGVGPAGPAGLDARPFFRGPVAYHTPVRAGRPELRLVDGRGVEVPPVVLLPLAPATATNRGNGAMHEVRVRLAQAIAREVRQLLADELTLADGALSRVIAPRDIFVLASMHTEAQVVYDELQAAGLPVSYESKAGWLGGIEGEDWLDLLSALERPHDERRRQRAWLTAFFGVPWEALPDLRRVDLAGAFGPTTGKPVGLAAQDADGLPARLHTWARQAALRLDAGFFARVLDESGLLRRLVFAGGPAAERARHAYQRVGELLATLVARERLGLGQLRQRLAELVARRGQGEEEGGGVGAARDAIQILTTHKSKGLEADVVFLVGGLGRRFTRSVRAYHVGGERRLCVDTYPPKDIADAIVADERAEEERLLYVALTRARGRLYLPCGEPVVGAYEAVNRQLAAARRAQPRLFVEARGFVGAAAPPRPPDDALLRRQLRGLGAAPQPVHAAEAPSPAQRGYRVTSYSRMKGEAATFDELSPPATLPADALPGGAGSGIFLHQLLEEVALPALAARPPLDAWAARPEVAELVARLGRQHGIAARHHAQAAALVHRAYTTPIATPDGGLRCLAGVDAGLRESEFVFALGGAAAPTLVRGVMDYVCEHRQRGGRRVWCVDWKSDVLPDYRPTTVAAYLEAHYGLQLRIYAVALGKMVPREAEAELGVLYVFLRGLDADGGGVYFAQPTRSDLADWEATLLTAQVQP